MKTLQRLLALAFCFSASCSSGRAQGTIQFINVGVDFNGVHFDAPVYEADRVTKLSGSQFMAELLAGQTLETLAPVAAAQFLTGNYAGYFNGGVATVNGINTFEIATVQVRVWNTLSGASFLQAQTSGLPNSWWESSPFTVSLGGPYANGAAPPARLTGLGTSPVYLNGVPEPSTLALAVLGGVLVLLRTWQERS